MRTVSLSGAGPVAADLLWVPTALPPGVEERRGRVMGSDLHVLVVGGASDHLDVAARRLEGLEARWSRFRPDSELSRLSGGTDGWVAVTADTWLLLDAMVTAWTDTGGRCDATVRDAIVAAGYDRDLRELAGADLRAGQPPGPTPGLAGVALDADGRSVHVPPGVGLDPGALGKGLAADLVAEELVSDGAAGVLVNVGGDLRVKGRPPEGEAWVVELVLDRGRSRRWALAEGGVATSSSRRRRWRVGGQLRHHLIDPATGQPIAAPPATVSVVAGHAWWAEAAATAVTVGGPAWAESWAPEHGVTGMVEDGAGVEHWLPGAARFLV
jgi:FAD:protein FMN transferase